MKRERPLILVVDDVAANRALLGKLLRHKGYDVVEAADGESALLTVAEEQPDLVCLDVLMPGMDGITVCRRLRADPHHATLPILMVTALNRSEDTARGLEAGANDFLSKPFDESELTARLRSLLRAKALQDQLSDMLRRYLSDSVAEEVLRNPFAIRLGGDRRLVSTLFADIRGYTSLADRHTPEQALDLLNGYLSIVSDSVEQFGGTVADLLGDGVFAFFGAPVMHSDDPERAVRTALHLQEAVGRLEIATMPGLRLQAGVGITSGEVIAGNIGSERRMHYAVVGDRVNVAARLQTAAGPGQILIDEATHDAVKGLVLSQDLGSLRLAGKEAWVRTFNVLGLRESELRPDAAIANDSPVSP
ncbi:MAG TPA: response regulator [Actinomycetales bacterium]|nr:response regulator [Actinomycetales bacterium]